MHPTQTIAALALTASLSLAACGGSDGDGGSSGLSRDDLVAKADSICSKAQAAAKAVPAPASLADAGVAAAYFGKIAPITHEETQDLAALEPADDVKGDWKTFVARQRAADDLLQTVYEKAQAKDPSGQEDLQKVDGTGQDVAVAAKKVGARQCTQ